MAARIYGIGILENPPGNPVPAAATWTGTIPWMSGFAGANPFWNVPPASAAPTSDCIYDVPDTQTLATGNNYVVPPGDFWLNCNTATLNLQINVNGTWTTLWTTTTTLTPIYFKADGKNVRLNNGNAGNVTFTLYRVQ
jgi:hypothetical protein